MPPVNPWQAIRSCLFGGRNPDRCRHLPSDRDCLHPIVQARYTDQRACLDLRSSPDLSRPKDCHWCNRAPIPKAVAGRRGTQVFQPTGGMLACLTQRLAWDDPSIRDLADYYRLAGLWGPATSRCATGRKRSCPTRCAKESKPENSSSLGSGKSGASQCSGHVIRAQGREK